MISDRRERTAELPTNERARADAHVALDRLLDDAMRLGFTGEAGLVAFVKDGVVNGKLKAKLESCVA